MRSSSLALLLTLVVAGCSDDQTSHTANISPTLASADSPGATDKPAMQEADYRGDIVRPNLATLPSPSGSTHHVSASSGNAINNSASLQSALCRLQPGDRLIVAQGEYPGPFIIDADCAQGTIDTPIEVYFQKDAVLTVDKDASVLKLSSSHWQINGMELEGGPYQSSPLVLDAAGNITLRNCHIHGGNGDGILIGPNSSDISIQRCHLHQFGAYADDNVNLSARGRSAAIRIAPGTINISVSQAGIHNVLGIPIAVMTPQDWIERGGDDLPAAEQIALSDIQFREWHKN